MMEERMFTLDIFEDNVDSPWLLEESLWRGITVELKELHNLKGAGFIKKLKEIVYYGEFHLVEGERVFTAQEANKVQTMKTC